MEKRIGLSDDPVVRTQEIRLACLGIALTAGVQLARSGSLTVLAEEYEQWVMRDAAAEQKPSGEADEKLTVTHPTGEQQGGEPTGANASAATPPSLKQGNGKK